MNVWIRAALGSVALSACVTGPPDAGDDVQASDSSTSEDALGSDGLSTSTSDETSTDGQGEITSDSDTEGADSSTDTTTETTDGETSTETSDTGADEGWAVLRQLDEQDGAMMSVWGPSPDQVFVVGGQIEPSTGTVLRFNGVEWIDEALPADTAMLDWVFGVEDRVWAVGRAGAIVVRDAGVWSAELSPTNKTLWGVWGASAEELWAVGGDGTTDVPLLLRRDGATQSWSIVALPDLGVVSHGLFKIWGTSASDVWAIGDRGATLHWDGTIWTAHPSEGAIDLISLWGSPNEGIIAAGGRASGRLARLEGETWIGMTLPTPGLNGMWVDPAGPITAVGISGTILSITPGSFEYVEEASPTPMVLHAVFGFSGGPRFAVGGSLLAPPPYIGVILGTP